MTANESSLGKAVLDLEANLEPFLKNMQAGKREANSMEDALDAIKRVAVVAEIELNKVKLDAATGAESNRIADRIERSVGNVGAAAAEASRHLERVKLEQAQANETEVAGDRIDRKLKDVTDNANEARRALESVHLAGIGAGGAGGGALGGLFGSGGGGGAGGMGALVGAGALLAPAAAPGAVGLLGAIPVLATGAAGALGTLALAFDDVGKAIGGNKKAFQGLVPAQQEFVQTVRSLEHGYRELKQIAGASLFPGLTAGLRSALSPGTFTAIATAVREFGNAIGQAAQQWGRYFGSPEFQRILGPLMSAGARNLGVMSETAMSLADALGVFARAAIPFTNWLVGTARAGAQWLDTWMHAKDVTGGLRSAMDEAKTSLTLVWNLFVALGKAVYELGAALYPVSKVALKDLVEALAFLAKLIAQNKQAITEVARTMFSDFVAVVKVGAEVVKALIHGLSDLIGHKDAVIATVAAVGAAITLALYGPWGLIIEAAVFAVGEIIRHWGAVRDFFETLGQWLINAFDYVWVELQRGALLAALAIVEPYSHLPSFLGGWARKAKDAMQSELDRLHAPNMDWSEAAHQAGVKSGQAWIAGFQSQAAAAAAGVPADTAAKATAGVAKNTGQSYYKPNAVYQLLVNAGFSPGDAANFVGIAKAESGFNFRALNNNPSTGDYSVGLFQENFFKSLGPARTARYAPRFGLSASMSPQAFVAWLQQHPAAQASIAYDLFSSSGYSPWKGDAYIKAHPELLNQGGAGGAGSPWGAPPPWSSGLGPKPPKPAAPPVIPAAVTTLLNAAKVAGASAGALSNTGAIAKQYLENELADLSLAYDELRAKLETAKGKARTQIATAMANIEAKIPRLLKEIADAIVVTGDALLPEKLRARMTVLSHKFAADSDYASVLTGDAAAKYQDTIRADLAAQAVVLGKEQASLKAKLATTHGKQHQAVVDELAKVTASLQGVQQQVLQNLQGVVSTLQGKVGNAFQTIVGELDKEFEAKTQQMVDELGVKFFQNGALTPAEQELAEERRAQTQAQLKQALDDATKAYNDALTGSLVYDASTGLTTSNPNNPALVAAQRQLDAANEAIKQDKLQTKATAERTEADRQYAQAVKALQAERSRLETEMNKRLADLGEALLNGTGDIGDLAKIAALYGLQITSQTIPDFGNLADAAGSLVKAFADLAAYIATITGTTPKVPAGTTVTAGSWTGTVDSNGVPIAAGFWGFDSNGKWIGGDISSLQIPKLDTGGTVMQTGLAVVHRGEEWSGVGPNRRSLGTPTVIHVSGVVGNEAEVAMRIGRELQKLNARGVRFDLS